jgi:hypothetical protein
MSMRLVDIWRSSHPYNHMAIDDLESFLWLTIWCIYSIIEEKSKLEILEAGALRLLRSLDVERHSFGRVGILSKITEGPITSPLVQLFRPLLSQWRDISYGAAREVPKLLELPDDELRQRTFNYFGKYLEAGFSHLSNIPMSWNEFFVVCVFSVHAMVTFAHGLFPAQMTPNGVASAAQEP